MLGVKKEVIKMIRSLPDEITIDDIMAELYFKLQVDAGLKELDEGKGIPHEEVEKRMSKWLSKLNGLQGRHLILRKSVTTLLKIPNTTLSYLQGK